MYWSALPTDIKRLIYWRVCDHYRAIQRQKHALVMINLRDKTSLIRSSMDDFQAGVHTLKCHSAYHRLGKGHICCGYWIISILYDRYQ